MDAAETIVVEVAYALPQRQSLRALRMPAGATVAAAIESSGILARFPGIDLASVKVGIFGRPCALDTLLRDGYRVEIYRQLSADPKQVRRQRALAGKPLGRKKPGGAPG